MSFKAAAAVAAFVALMLASVGGALFPGTVSLAGPIVCPNQRIDNRNTRLQLRHHQALTFIY